MSKWQDIAISDANLKAEFITRFFNGDYISAFRIIEDNPQLNTKAFLANVMNEISNLLSLLQNNFQSNVIDYLANELDGFNNLINEFNLKGSWDSETTYEIYNFVIYNNIDYLYINPTPSSGNLPTNTNYWLEINIRGETGEPGLGVNLKYDWDSTIEYQPLDVVYYSNALWVATATNVNKRPDENSGTIWQTLTGNIITFTNNNDLKFKSIAVNFTPIQVLPDYQFVEYIESSGTQYIDTGISLNEDDFIIECRFARTEATTAEQAIVSIWEGTSNYWNAFVNSGGLVDIYTAGHHHLNNTAITNDTQYDLTLQRSTNHWKAIFSGSEVTWDYTPSMNNSTTIKLFTRGDTPNTNYSNTHAKIYYVKIYRNGTLVGNFVPSVRPSDSAIGMYDSVSKTFFANTGTGTFAKGSDITIPNPNIFCPISGHTGATVYLSDNEPVPYIDGYYYNDNGNRVISANTRYETVYIPVSQGTVYKILFDATSSNRLRVHEYDSSKEWLRQIISQTVSSIEVTYIPSADAKYVRISYPIVCGTINLCRSSMPITWQDEAGTVYDGFVVINEDGSCDVTAEKVAYELQTVGQSNWNRSSSYPGGFYTSYARLYSKGVMKARTPFICSHAKTATTLNDYIYGTCYSDGSINIRIMPSGSTTEEWQSYLNKQAALGTPVTICGELETPQTIHLPSVTMLSTLVGTNTVWVNDATGDITVELEKKYWEIFLPFKLIKIYSNTTAPTGDDLYNGVIWFEMLTS